MVWKSCGYRIPCLVERSHILCSKLYNWVEKTMEQIWKIVRIENVKWRSGKLEIDKEEVRQEIQKKAEES